LSLTGKLQVTLEPGTDPIMDCSNANDCGGGCLASGTMTVTKARVKLPRVAGGFAKRSGRLLLTDDTPRYLSVDFDATPHAVNVGQIVDLEDPSGRSRSPCRSKTSRTGLASPTPPMTHAPTKPSPNQSAWSYFRRRTERRSAAPAAPRTRPTRTRHRRVMAHTRAPAAPSKAPQTATARTASCSRSARFRSLAGGAQKARFEQAFVELGVAS
jgi:hypothetical protein